MKSNAYGSLLTGMGYGTLTDQELLDGARTTDTQKSTRQRNMIYVANAPD